MYFDFGCYIIYIGGEWMFDSDFLDDLDVFSFIFYFVDEMEDVMYD